jgi:hypothetical protein
MGGLVWMQACDDELDDLCCGWAGGGYGAGMGQ